MRVAGLEDYPGIAEVRLVCWPPSDAEFYERALDGGDPSDPGS